LNLAVNGSAPKFSKRTILAGQVVLVEILIFSDIVVET